jgi:hypothetical protein
MDLDEILYGDDYIEDDLGSTLSNHVASNISKLRTFKLLRRVQLLSLLVYLDESFYCGNCIKGDLDLSKIAV